MTSLIKNWTNSSCIAGYIGQLDGKDFVLICVKDAHNLYKEAYSFYVRFSKPEQAQEKEQQINVQVLRGLGVTRQSCDFAFSHLLKFITAN